MGLIRRTGLHSIFNLESVCRVAERGRGGEQITRGSAARTPNAATGSTPDNVDVGGGGHSPQPDLSYGQACGEWREVWCGNWPVIRRGPPFPLPFFSISHSLTLHHPSLLMAALP